MRPAPRRTPRAAIAVLFLLGAVAAGCGGDRVASRPRPPTQRIVSAVITPRAITTSPALLRGGPIELLISNQTRTSQRLTLAAERLGRGARPVHQTTGPINPGDTATLTAELPPGTYRVSVPGNAIRPATLVAGPPPQSARDRRLQP